MLIKNKYKRCQIFSVENKGRDFYPFPLFFRNFFLCPFQMFVNLYYTNKSLLLSVLSKVLRANFWFGMPSRDTGPLYSTSCGRVTLVGSSCSIQSEQSSWKCEKFLSSPSRNQLANIAGLLNDYDKIEMNYVWRKLLSGPFTEN
jgi:hypothetical protein